MKNNQKVTKLLNTLEKGMADLLELIEMSAEYYDNFNEFKTDAMGSSWVSFENQMYKIEITPK